MMKNLLRDRVTVHTKSHGVFTDVPASVQRNKIFIVRTDIPIQPGDEIARNLPSGISEVYIVEDPGFHSGMEDIPDTYQMVVRRADAMPRPGPATSVVYNVTGTNARFNINSVDTSTNVVNSAPSEMFEALREAVRRGVPGDEEKSALIEKADELEREVGKANYLQSYQQFVALAANHILTWNCKHLANAALRTRIEQVCRLRGYEPVIICTPEELLED